MGLLDDAIREHLDLKRRRGGDPAEIERLEREALGPVRREPTTGMAPPSYEERPSAVAETLGTREESYGAHDEPDDTDFEPGSAETALHDLPEEPPAPREPHPDFHGAVGAQPQAEEPHPKRRFLRRPSSLAAPPRDETREDVPVNPDAPRGETPTSEPAAPTSAGPVAPRREPEPPHLTLEGEIRHEHDDDEEPEDRPTSAGRPAPSDVPPEEQATQVHRVEPQERRTGETVEYDVREEFHAEDRGRETVEPEPETERRREEAEESDEPRADKDDEGDVLEETPEFLQDTPEHDRLWFEQRPPRDFDFDG